MLEVGVRVGAQLGEHAVAANAVRDDRAHECHGILQRRLRQADDDAARGHVERGEERVEVAAMIVGRGGEQPRLDGDEEPASVRRAAEVVHRVERPRQPVEVAERLGVLRVGEEIGRSERVAVRIGRAQQRLMAAHLAVGRAHDRLERAREAALRRVRDRDAIARLAESRRRKVIVAQPVKHGLEHHRNSSCVSLPFDTHVVRGHIDVAIDVCSCIACVLTTETRAPR